jgi:hypothetical protein
VSGTSQSQSEGSTRTFTAWVPFLPLSPNRLLRAHWGVVSRNKAGAWRAWQASVRVETADEEKKRVLEAITRSLSR